MKSIIALGCAVALFASPALAQSASGSASGAGASQGGSGSPGSGTGTPGAVQAGETATGIGTDATGKQPPVVPGVTPAPAQPAAPAQ